LALACADRVIAADERVAMPRLFGRRRSGSTERPLPRLPTDGDASALRRAGRCAVIVGTLGLLVAACGLPSAIEAPLRTLTMSDVVVETNLQSVATATDGIGSGVATTTGPSTTYHTVSVSSAAGHPTVLAGFNQLSNDCLGLVEITSPGFPVLGENQSGTFYFWVLGTTSPACDAASFAATTTAPSHWPTGDPSSSGFPAG